MSVVVPVLNGASHLATCLESLAALDWPADRREILVVDNGSTDDTVAVARRFEPQGVRVLDEPQRGAANARNTGWRAAGGELIAFTDCDCRVSPGWVRRLVAAFADPTVGGAGGPLLPAPPTSVIEEYIIDKDILSQERAMRDEVLSPPFLVTANAMYRRSDLETIGGFDPWLSVNGEDADLSWRIVWEGYRLEYVAGADVVHFHRSTLRSFLRQVGSYGEGTSYLFAKYGRRFGFRRFTCRWPYYEMLRGFALAPIKLATGRTRLDRFRPLLEGLGGLWFVSGKLRASARLKVWHV